jgi:hypothetical protein
MFDGAEERAQAVAVPLLYGIVEAVVIGLYCVWAWKVGWTKAPPNEKICTVITKSYEIVREEDTEDDNGENTKRAVEEDGQVPSSSLQATDVDTTPDTKASGKDIYNELRRLFKEDEADLSPVPVTDRSVELDVDPVTGEVDTRYKTPPSKNSRKRFTSDYTTETASTTPSPQISRGEEDEFGEQLAI